MLVSLPAFAQQGTTSAGLPPVTAQMLVVWLVSLALGAASYLAKAGVFNGKAIPAPWLTRLAIVASFLGGAYAFMSGPNFSMDVSGVFYAVASGVSALGAGALPGLVGHALFVAPAQHAALAASRASVGGPPPSAGGSSGDPDKTKPPATTRLAWATATLALFAAGCGWFAANSPTLVTYTEQDVQCVFAQLFGGDLTLDGILAACVPLTATQALAILESIVSYYTSPSPADAGAAGMGATVCGTGTPPVKGLPVCISADKLAQLRGMRDVAKAKIAAGAK